jgi:hypothetical protein
VIEVGIFDVLISNVQYKIRTGELEFVDKLLIIMIILGGISAVLPFVFGGKIAFNELQGVSMSETIPNGNYILWLYVPGYDGLKVGDIGCYNDPLIAANMSSKMYIACHHVNYTSAAFTLFHTDRYCKEMNDKTIICNIYEDEVLPENIMGKVLYVLPSSYAMLMITLSALILLWLIDSAFKKEEPPKGNMPKEAVAS